MEREVKRKTIAYGTAAILSALLLAAFAYNFGIQPTIQPTLLGLKTFQSYDELENFLKTNINKSKTFSSNPQIISLEGGLVPETNVPTSTLSATPAYSTTNVQVAGVDEADIVKTDGTYLYVVSGNTIYIIGADPSSQPTFMRKITLNETNNLEIYINGDKLAILGTRYPYPVYKAAPETVATYPYVYTEEVIIKVYDLTDIANPVLARAITMNGTLAGSRMIGDYLYASIVQPALRPDSNETNLMVMLPEITVNDVAKEVQPTEIRYVNTTYASYYFTTVIAVNLKNDAQQPTHETFLASTGAQMYVSQDNMYLTVLNTNWWLTPLQTGEIKEETMIYRISLNKEKVVFQAQGSVQGYVLNQFSMDEYNGFFRVVTTTGWGTNSVNNLYVLNMNLSTIGKLENLAPTERIYSARFMGNRAYLVTFRQVDPFFVIDLTSPTQPAVLGFLKIPGFSGYLHPYDENHIIGVGKQGNNVKLSLFDVTDVTAPTEAVPSYIVNASWSDTTVTYDSKAFLFDKSKQLLALPVSINWAKLVGGTYYDNSWQGEYVFNISLTNGFELKGNVTHQDVTQQWNSDYSVKRALYIDNVLYTVSDKKIAMNNLEDLRLLKEIDLG